MDMLVHSERDALLGQFRGILISDGEECLDLGNEKGSSVIERDCTPFELWRGH